MPTLESLILELEVQGGAQAQQNVNRTAQSVQQLGQAANTAGQQTTSIYNSMKSLGGLTNLFNAPAGAFGGGMGGSIAGAGGGMAGGGGGIGGMMNMAAVAGPLGFAVMAFSKIAEIAGQIVAKFQEFWREAVAFAKEFLDIKSLTGGTDKQAIGIQNRFTAAGIPASSVARDLARLADTGQNPAGQNALSKLHVSRFTQGADGTMRRKNGAELFEDVTASLRNMADGVRKVKIETELFGERGAIAMQSVFRITDAQQANLDRLTAAFSGEGAKAITTAQASMNILGQTMMERIVYPITTQVAPVLQFFADKIALVINYFSDLNDAMGGQLGRQLAMIAGLVGTVITALIINISSLITVLEALLWPFSKLFDIIVDGMKKLGIDKILEHFGVDVNGDKRKDPLANRALSAAERTADGMDKLNGKIVGGLSSERGNMTKTNIELESAIARALVGG